MAVRGFSVRGNRADEQGNFASRRFVRQRSSQFNQRTAAKLFVDFRHFARQASRAISQDFMRVYESFFDTMRRFVKNNRAILDAKPLQRTAPLAPAGGEPASENKIFIRHTARP